MILWRTSNNEFRNYTQPCCWKKNQMDFSRPWTYAGKRYIAKRRFVLYCFRKIIEDYIAGIFPLLVRVNINYVNICKYKKDMFSWKSADNYSCRQASGTERNNCWWYNLLHPVRGDHRTVSRWLPFPKLPYTWFGTKWPAITRRHRHGYGNYMDHHSILSR